MLRVAGIEQESMIDGEGIRFVLFMQGCSHNCTGCHNPETHDFHAGTSMKMEDIIKLTESDPLIDGVTLSGGDPFFQAKKLIPLCKYWKSKGLNIWAYTGFIFDEFMKYKENKQSDDRLTSDMIELLNYLDVVVDGPFIIDKRTLGKEYIGSSNQRLIDVQKTLKSNAIILYELNNDNW
ncbi:MAG: anaerobic ribonucleoside-triphosphate reductase activating protein [Lachnospiraceae bacterium]|nr:anaerobic ribonucleoside-triphosphate reductase activating protein [Lachnospiraceae bacterium]